MSPSPEPGDSTAPDANDAPEPAQDPSDGGSDDDALLTARAMAE